MKNITTNFNLNLGQIDLNFIDINLDRDNLLFIDPRLIENSNSLLAQKMEKRIGKFWAELIKAVNLNDKLKIKNLLSGLKEPSETKLGYAKNNKSGNSVGDKLKPKIIKAILNNKAIKTGLLSHFCDTELFIEDIGCDRISDITTKIIKEVLIEFTQIECNKLLIPMSDVFQDDIFDYNTLTWNRRKVLLPIYNGKPIIFVPKLFVRLGNSTNNNLNSLYRYAVKHYIQYDLSMLKDVSATGKKGKIMLKDIKESYPLSKESLVNWCHKFGKLLVNYKSEKLNDKIKSLSDDQIMEIIYDNSYLKAV